MTRWFGPLVLLMFAVTAFGAVDWSLTGALALLVTVGLAVAGLRRAWQSDPGAVAWSNPTFLWRTLVLLVGCLVALPYLENLAALRDAGWTPTWQDEPLGPLTYPLNAALIGLPGSPEVAATAVWVLFVATNECLFAVRRVLWHWDGPADGHAGHPDHPDHASADDASAPSAAPGH